jgi:hypothetical protein
MDNAALGTIYRSAPFYFAIRSHSLTRTHARTQRLYYNETSVI